MIPAAIAAPNGIDELSASFVNFPGKIPAQNFLVKLSIG